MTEVLAAPGNNFIRGASGEMMDPVEIEGVYTKVAPVKEMCVFMVPAVDGDAGAEVLWAVIQPDLSSFREFSEVNLCLVLKERFDNASQTLPAHKRLKGFTVTFEGLPHTPAGALQRYEIRELYEPRVAAGIEGALPLAGELSAEDLIMTRSVPAVKIIECLRKQCGIRRPILLTDSLELDLGVDSLGRVELLSRLELVFGVHIKDEVVSRAFRVKGLIKGVTDALPGAEEVPPEDQGVSLGQDYWKEHLRVLPKKENLELLELSTGFFAWLFRVTLTAIDCLVFRLFFNISSKGEQNVPKDGAYIIYGNHTSFLDGPAIGACLPRRPVFQLFYFVFGPYFFRPFIKNRVLRNLVKMGRFIPFDYSTHFLEALRSAYYVLEHGKGLCFFPEGLRSSTGEIGEFRRGFGILAKVTGAKLVPVIIDGAHEAWASTAKYPRYHRIRVRFGKPLLSEDLEREGLAMGSQNSYDAICAAARKALVALKEQP